MGPTGEAGRAREPPSYLADAMVRLDPAPQDKREACQALLRRLARPASGENSSRLVDVLVQFCATAEDITVPASTRLIVLAGA